MTIDFPFRILSCQATQANTALPAYSAPEPVGDVWVHECGCPGAPVRRASLPRFVPTLDTLIRSRGNLDATLPGTGLTGLQQDKDEGPLPPPETPP